MKYCIIEYRIKTYANMKKTLLTIVAALFLCGVVNAQQPTWPTATLDAHRWSSNTPIVAAVSIDGVVQTDLANLTLGAFAGSDELRGRANVTNYSVYDYNNSAQFWIQVFYNYNTTEDISFKLYDAANQTEYATCEVTKPTQDEGWGTPGNPVELNFAATPQTVTQTLTLSAGWNWVSFSVSADDLLAQLEEGLGDNGVMIEGLDGVTMNIGGGNWWGDLNDVGIMPGQLYFVEVGDACSVEVSGTEANPSEIEITINPEWNWIGFPCSQELPILQVSGFNPEEGDMIEGINGATMYLGNGDWWGEISTLVPGQGYMYFSNSSQTKTLKFVLESKKR